MLVDGQDAAIVRGAFPQGSSSYLFAHYKVDFIDGDRAPAGSVDLLRRSPPSKGEKP